MFKQSHIVLSGYLADEMQKEEIKRCKGSLRFGSVQPDLSPRQRMKDHEFEATWKDTKKRIQALENYTITDIHSERAACRQIGTVLHYLADYFTCPHNPSYNISMTEHCFYEGRQAYLLRAYLHSKEAEKQVNYQNNFAAQLHNSEELIAHIEKMHGLYLKESSHTPQSDCRWIVGVCACTARALSSMVYGDTSRDECLVDSVA